MEAHRTVTVRKPRRSKTILATAIITAAIVAPTSAVAATDLLDVGDGIKVRDSATGEVVEGTVKDGKWVFADPDAPSPTSTGTPTGPTPTAEALQVTVKRDGASTATVTWAPALIDATVSRDGRDTSGSGAWTSPAGASSPTVLTRLVAASPYKVTVSGKLAGRTLSQTVTLPASTTTALPSTPPTETTTAPVSPTVPPSTGGPADTGGKTPGWLSGQSGVSRGAEEVTATWSDNDSASRDMSKFRPGGEFGKWCASVDLAVGAFDRGESWSGAAGGSQDADWKASTAAIASAWGGLQERCKAAGDDTPNYLFIRFAHEANGNWYPWSFGNTDPAVVKRAFARYAGILAAAKVPNARLVMSMNRESVGMSRAWTDYFPGNTVVDVMNVDYYNQFPYVASKAQWDASMGSTTSGGAPKGLQAHLDFAKRVGLPLSLGEWSGNADNGDSPVFVEQMHAFFKANAGSGAGQILYEIQFNVDKDGRRWLLSPGNTRMPKSAATYQQLFP